MEITIERIPDPEHERLISTIQCPPEMLRHPGSPSPRIVISSPDPKTASEKEEALLLNIRRGFGDKLVFGLDFEDPWNDHAWAYEGKKSFYCTFVE